MATVILDDGSLYDIADAIRSKLGVSTTYLPREMADAIMSIETQEIIQGYYIANNFFEDSAYTIPIFGEVGKFYVDLSDGGIYRYDGSDYIELSEGLRLGETDSTAYRGDRGKIAYDHAQARGSAYTNGLYKVTTNSEGHVTEAVQVQKSDITSLGIPTQDTTYSDATTSSSGLMSGSDKSKLNGIEAGATANTPSTATPLMDGTASAGSSDAYARGDHRHPTDTTRMAADLKGAANGVAELDAGGKVPSSQLPSYVDDVLEYSSQSALPATGETGKIYVTTDTNTSYRWSGSAYVPISNPLDYATQAEAEAGAENTHVMTPLRVKQAIDENAYELPEATTTALGGVKYDGSTIAKNNEGQLHVPSATTSAAGLMSSTDKAKLDGIEANANAYTLPLMSSSTRGGAKLGHGLTVEDGALGIGEVTDPTDAGPIVALSAKGWAEQDTTVGKNLANYNGVNNVVIAHCIAGTTYTFSLTATANSVGVNLKDGSNSGATIASANPYTQPITFTPSSDCDLFMNGFAKTSGEQFILIASKIQLELGSTATSYEPYTGGAPSPSPSHPQEIKVCRGRNLIDESNLPSASHFPINYYNIALPIGQYVISFDVNSFDTQTRFFLYVRDSNSQTVLAESVSASAALGRISMRFTTMAISSTLSLYFNGNVSISNIQLEAGTEAHPYVPYGCVGVDVTANGTTTTIPIPLPSRGWVAALPDGTADTLALDGAGGFTWELNTQEITFDGSSDEVWNLSSGSKRVYYNALVGIVPYAAGTLGAQMCDRFPTVTGANTYNGVLGVGVQSGQLNFSDGTGAMTVESWVAWLAQNPVTVLYPLAVPTTEQGYVDSMSTVPVHAAISSVDLVDLAVRCCADEGAAEIASAWGRKYESRIAALESAVATLLVGA